MEWLDKNNRGLVMACAGFSLAMGVEAAETPTVKFNTAFIQGSDQPADLSEFIRGNSVVPGVYRVDVYVNRALSGRRDITFKQKAGSALVEPCLGLEMLQDFGLDLGRVQEKGGAISDQGCFDLVGQVQFAHIEYQPTTLRLNISVPQAYMARSARGYVAPELWDVGETTGFINYNFNGTQRRNSQLDTDQYYLGLRNGLNLGAWRLRNEASLTYGNHQPYRYRSNRTYAQRDLTDWRSQLTLGETYTDSQIFDSVRFKGAAIASDDGMLPDSERVFAPVIRGIAETNALVEVRQNGFLLYSGNVSPGPFEISDIYPSGSNGDLEVTVIEADGRRRSFTQAYASLPIMLPAGALRYGVAAGQVDNYGTDQASPNFLSATLVYGLSERLTGYGGVQVAEDYQAGNVGMGVNTGLGAVSADLTQSISKVRGQDRVGESLRLRYANTLDLTNTTLAVAGYRYSTEHYRTLNDHVEEAARAGGRLLTGLAKDRLEMSVSQALPEQLGFVSLTASEQRYWNLSGKTRQFYVSYNAAWRSLSYSVSLERNQQSAGNGDLQTDNQLAVTLSMPLGSNPGSSRAWFNGVRDSRGDYTTQAGLSGQVLEDRDTFYSVQAGHDSYSGSSGAGKLDTTTAFGRFNAGYSQGRDFHAVSVGAAGSLVAHRGGLNAGQPLGETFALVEVPDVAGARLGNFNNVQTSGNGYAVMPYAQPYRANWVSLDTRSLGADVDLDTAITQVVPRRGAVPVVHFKAALGRRVQFELVRADGSRLPMGASVEDANGKLLAVVDPASRALVLSEQEQGELSVRWSDQRCRAPFSLPPRDSARAYERLRVVCQ
ncbi:outer membrane usher protein [Pseudomonas sp. JUb42]|nr:outer membrane usher protein [Pseudomonas sp. JUb42]